MAAPEKVRLKRKRQDDPLEALILTKQDAVDQDVSQVTPQKRIRYKLVNDATPGQTNRQIRSRSPLKDSVRRLFHLRRSTQISHDGQAPNSKAGASLPTFEERPSEQTSHSHSSRQVPMDLDESIGSSNNLKRPGKGSTLGRTQNSAIEARKTMPSAPQSFTEARKAQAMAQKQEEMQALANMLHEATLEEMARIPKPTTQIRPSMSPKQARDRHERKLASRETTPITDDTAMTDAGDFVYDTYVRVSGDEQESTAGSRVGYLVIAEEDEAYWQSFTDGVEGVDEEEKDEDDENAEDHYAADYPEDEDHSDDDEFASRDDHNHGEASEEWDHREEYDEQPSIVQKWERIIHGHDDDE